MEKKDYNYVRKGFRVEGQHYVVTGKTEEEAIEKALAQLGKDRDEVSVEILRQQR